jgi:hypothetical protein
MDDATAGADSMERLEALSGEMEAVAKRGGFEFKEPLCLGIRRMKMESRARCWD